jgi:S1-C subfamily serine protease
MHRRSIVVATVLVVLLILLGFAVGLGWREALGAMSPAIAPAPAARPVVARGDLAADETATIELFKRASPAVVYVTSISLRRDWFSLNVQRLARGTGSGFVWDESGHVVTNFHVIQGSDAARVTLYDQTTWEADLVGVAPEKDLAVLRIREAGARIQPIALGGSSNLLVGQKVFAIGNPFGLDQTLTTGIISALGREIESVTRIPIRDVIQTDAAINPGNSGGPLLDSAGRLIGVNTAIYSPSGGSAGVGFAIPVDTVNWVVPELILKGRVERPTLGVELVSAQMVANLDLEGALIMRVVEGSGADRAGLRGTYQNARGRVILGDIIVKVGDRPVSSSDDLGLALERHREGEVVEVTLIRDDTERQVEVELGAPSRR